MSIKIVTISIIVFTFAGVVIAADDPNELDYKPGELIVRFAPKENGKQRSKAERKQILDSIDGGEVKHTFKRISGLTVVKLKDKDKVKDKLKDFKNKKGILYAEPNYKLKLLSTTPNDTYFNNIWGMHNTGQTINGSTGTADADIDAIEAWGVATDADDIIVAVLDTGVDYDHEDLATNMWTNQAELNGTTGVDDDGNGYIDDVYGWDFADDDRNPDDYNGHGTHCAGTIGAIGENSKGVTGVCWKTYILALKIFPNYGDAGFIVGAIDAIEYAVDMGATVLSNSWGGGYFSQSLKDVIIDTKDAGVLFIAAAGNDSAHSALYPAKYDLDNVISVMATDHNDERSSFSNYHEELVDIAAPGTDIYSCQPNDQYGYSDGTSMAAPHVAGACALVWARNPALSHLEVKDIILRTADRLDSLDGLCVTEGRLNLYNAILEVANLNLSVEDGINEGDCATLDDEIGYMVSWSNPVSDPNESGYLGDVDNVVMTSYLSEWVDFDSVFISSGSYDPNAHAVTSQIGTLSPGESGSIYIKVKVNDQAVPLEEIVNYVEITSDTVFKWAEEKTSVCCFGEKVVYVDTNSTAVDPNGASWELAFNNLNDALSAARVCDDIWVADGTYQITTNPTDTDKSFIMRKGISVYGGFAGDEESFGERDWSVNETILSGFIDSFDDDPNRVDYVVADPNNPSTILDGFTITGAGKAGVYIKNTTSAVSHNKISDSGKGIYCLGTEKPIIRNNWLYKNDYGIYFDSPVDVAKVYNNTIADNTIAGLHMEGGTAPEVSNCIFTGHPDDKDIIGCYTTYSYLEFLPMQYDSSDPNIPIGTGIGNVDGDPNFPPYVTGTDDYHITSGSACIDAGDPNGNYIGQRDIDVQFRVLDGDDDASAVIDMGADEYCDETPSDADFNSDGIVDYIDFVVLADAWLTISGDGDYNETCDLVDDNVIGVYDLAVFADEWLWMSCEYMRNMPMPISSEQMFMSAVSMSFAPEIVAVDDAMLAENICTIIEYVDAFIEEEHENAENLIDMKVFLEDVLEEL